MTVYASLGSISEGTVLPEELIPAFADELARLARLARCYSLHRKLIKEARALDSATDDESELHSELLTELSEALGTFAPPYAYFGAHHVDGEDFGFWLCESFDTDMSEDGVLRVTDLSAVPRAYTGEVALISDHGNCTLFSSTRGRRRLIWAVV
jgi:hypothetical protein